MRRLPRRYEIAEMSMAPTLLPGDWVITLPVRRGEVRVGDVVVFTHPDRPGFDLVKRVTAVTGDLVDPVTYLPVRPDDPRAWTVPAGHCIVLGDARDVSLADSRTLGPIPTASLRGRVVAIYWPRHRIGRI